ncbi:hypothetical protein [Bradyrhizobium sp. LTSPM299]|uniref:hypothetical protein n=1 Tax=Bradyrhizobium sp. LTSPM299 TaxID=1619233 RepID=UPI000B2BF3B4|nr:hypothetical protein [Bradyrhizobium sp. LTSPM299]
MHSLKSFIPLLPDVLGLSEYALYERQRALVRGGLLTATKGRGPGSGVKATPENVAMLIISVLATDSLSDVVAHTNEVSKAIRHKSQSADALPTVRTFRSAVVHCLSSDDDEITWIQVFRQPRTAAVGLKSGGSIQFGQASLGAFVFITAEMPSAILPYLRGLLRQSELPSPADNVFRIKSRGERS